MATKKSVGAPPGNKNAANGSRWKRAIIGALEARAKKRKSKSDAQQELVRLAESLLRSVEMGDVSAMKELGNRIDGQVPKALEIETKETMRRLVIVEHPKG